MKLSLKISWTLIIALIPFIVLFLGCTWKVPRIAAETAGRVSYYVALNGSDDNPGTAELPFRTIQKAADIVVPGDRVLVRPGEYKEYVLIKTSGEPGKPIIFEGTRGVNGEWLTIIDPSVPVSNWEPAPEVGKGVFKTAGINFGEVKTLPDKVPGVPGDTYDKQKLGIVPRCMTARGKHLARIREDHMAKEKGFHLLSLAPDAMVQVDYVDQKTNYWNGIEALYGWREGITYIRFRNGDDPNKMEVRAAPAGAAWLIRKGQNVVRGFLVRGAEHGVVIEGTNANFNVIEQNSFMHGRNRVVVQYGASSNAIQDNEMTLNYFGGEPGAWGGATDKGWGEIRCQIYREFKNTVGYGGSDDNAVLIRNGARDTKVCRNHIFNGLIGISSYKTRGVNAHHNNIHNMSSIGIETVSGVVDGFFHDNLVYDCNINLRIHHYNDPNLQRREYHYRNCSYQPRDVGMHIYVHNNDTVFPRDTEYPEILIYHNTYVGGNHVLGVGYLDRNPMARTRLLNNIWSAGLFLSANTQLVANANTFDAWDYNWCGGKFRHKFYEKTYLAWFGRNNIIADGETLWSHDKLPDFQLSKDSPVRNRGVDLSGPFVAAGKKFNPLPGMEKGYFHGMAPDLGALQYGEVLTVGPAQFK